MSKLRTGTRPVRRAEYWAILASIAFVPICFYGIRAAAVIGLAAVTAMLTDLVCLFLRGRPYKLVDLSNIGHAVVLALLFPATIPYSIVILSTVFSVAVGTHVFGYRRDLLFPPAAVGYLFALTCWKEEVLQFPAVMQRLALFHNDVPLGASLTSQFNEKGSFQALHTETLDLLIGAVPGAMGTGCILLLGLGIVILMLRRQLNFFAALGFIYCGFLPMVFESYSVGVYATNMLLFSLIYFVADPAVMPCRGLSAFLAGLITSAVTGALIVLYHIEYAPMIAVVLCCPVWRWMYAFSQRITTAKTEGKEQEDTANA